MTKRHVKGARVGCLGGVFCLVALFAVAGGCSSLGASSGTAHVHVHDDPRSVEVAAPPIHSEDPCEKSTGVAGTRAHMPWVGGIRLCEVLRIGGPFLERESILRGESKWKRGETEAALEELRKVDSPAAWLLRARIAREQGEFESSFAALEKAAKDPELRPAADLEKGNLHLRGGDHAAAMATLAPLVQNAGRAMASRSAMPLAEAMLSAAPATLVETASSLEGILPTDDPDARSRFLALQADALQRLGRTDDAALIRKRQFLEEPVSRYTPESWAGPGRITKLEALERGERLLNAHRNQMAVEALKRIGVAGLDAEQQCRRRFGLGLAQRKLHRYEAAERHLRWVAEQCKDPDLIRRASYLLAKVVSIRSGLEAVPIIESFVKQFAGHSMVDDVLFWAGDLYQRRGRLSEAERYYQQATQVLTNGDYCAEAQWRLGWVAWRDNRQGLAEQRWLALTNEAQCSPSEGDRARAWYWLAKVADQGGSTEAARERYQHVVKMEPFGVYGQMALSRLLELDGGERNEWESLFGVAKASMPPALCVGRLASVPSFRRGIKLLAKGLRSDAADELRTLVANGGSFLGGAHAESLGVGARMRKEDRGAAAADTCPPGQARMMLGLLLHEAGAGEQAQWLLRTEFSYLFRGIPNTRDVHLFRAAFPLPYRRVLQEAETKNGLPDFFLQGLAREESAFDAGVVSWAGAYGLLQLLERTGRRVAAGLSPPLTIAGPDDLLDPRLNAQLGGALMGDLWQRFKGQGGLCLVAYNASERLAQRLLKRHSEEGFDTFVEEIPIRETRGYVKRVLRTFAVYRWLYADALPVFAFSQSIN